MPCTNEGYCTIPTAEVLGKQPQVQRCKEANDGTVHFCAAAKWSSPHELKADLRNASVLKNNRVVFSICGNKYRIVVLTDYARQGMLIRFVGTHEQYDGIKDIAHI
ncbi:MAG: type II toxin-antitoxin system HigB family toxin [Pseudomonadota bacterium]